MRSAYASEDLWRRTATRAQRLMGWAMTEEEGIIYLWEKEKRNEKD